MSREKRLRLAIIFLLIFGCAGTRAEIGNADDNLRTTPGIRTTRREMRIKNIKRLNTLEDEFKRRINFLLTWAQVKFHNDITIACTYRSPEEQNRLYKKGPSTTKLKGWESKHQHGLAVDIYFVRNGKIVPYGKDYLRLGEKAESLGITWGGRWKIPFDPGHFELRR